jgi:hypothetical protein
VVVQNNGQPRSHRTACLVEDRDVEEGVVHLPLLVRAPRSAAEDYLEPVPVCGVAVLGEGTKTRVKSCDHCADAAVAQSRKAPVLGDVADPAMNERRGRFRPAQRQSFDHLDQFGRDPPAATVDPAGTLQPMRGGIVSVLARPPSERANRHPRHGGDPGPGGSVIVLA